MFKKNQESIGFLLLGKNDRTSYISRTCWNFSQLFWLSALIKCFWFIKSFMRLGVFKYIKRLWEYNIVFVLTVMMIPPPKIMTAQVFQRISTVKYLLPLRINHLINKANGAHFSHILTLFISVIKELPAACFNVVFSMQFGKCMSYTLTLF